MIGRRTLHGAGSSPGEPRDAPSTVWTDGSFTIRRGDVPFIDRLLARGLVTSSEHARLVVLVLGSRLTVRVAVVSMAELEEASREGVRRCPARSQADKHHPHGPPTRGAPASRSKDAQRP